MYGQSGGPTSVINSSSYGLFKQAFKHKDIIKEIFVMHYGFEGLLKEDLILIKNEPNLKKLINTPGAIFGSNRFKINFSKDTETLEKIYNVLKKYNIRYFFYNGGNDSMDSIYQINLFLKKQKYKCNCIGIPKTIDNDIVFMDHTPGFGSATKFIINAVTEIYYDDFSYKKGRVNIVEIMGRNTGWLTASSMLSSLNNAKPDLIYVPEVDFDPDDFLNKVQKIYETKKHCLVCVSEGIHDKNGNLISISNETYDVFNHLQLGGVGAYLTKLVETKFNYKTRYFELSLLQRANSIIPSEQDIKEAVTIGKKALLYALKGKSGYMVNLKRISNEPYKIKYELIDLALVKNKTKYLPLTYVNSTKDNINESYISYVLPLISGKQKNHLREDGLLDIYFLEKHHDN